MALMTSMRNRMHAVLWFLLIMFLLSMTIGGLVGGANIIDQIFGRVNPMDAIGVVNGTPISPDDFTQAVNQRLTQYRANGQEPNERTYHDLRNEVWDNYIQDILVYQKIDELEITASDEEVLYHLRNNPPPFLIQEQAFLTDGVFDAAKYEQALNNPQGNEWVQIERFMKETYIPNYKLQQYIAAGVVVTNKDVYDKYIKDKIEYTIEGVHIMGLKLKDDIAAVTELELKAAYENDLESFAKEETRNIRYVSWKKEPASRDTARVHEEALELIDKAKSGSDFAKLANFNTADPSNQVTPDSGRGGNLGWFAKGQMVPAFEEAAFAANKGTIVGPVLSRFGYHIIKVIDKRQKDNKEEINAAHILLKIDIGSQTREDIRRQATRLSYDTQDYGFDAALDSHRVNATKAENLLYSATSIQGLGFFRDVVRFAFSDQSDIGSVSDRLENDNFYIVAVLDSIIPEGTKSFDEVKSNLTNQVIRDKQQAVAFELATAIKTKISAGASLTDLVSDDNRLELLATDKKKLNRGFISIGRSHSVIGALLNSEIGDLVGPLETARGYAVVRLLAVTPFDSTDFQEQEADLYSALVNVAQQSAFDTWLADLREGAKIIDNRRFYY
ncbi:MAG: SurA N-terminal domain-containing protein [Candidatus Marinimicrobia bacterium]|nr:SurA N-terminal domain-containing protein [Candidatus Neomarinimicrobiota bacterium]